MGYKHLIKYTHAAKCCDGGSEDQGRGNRGHVYIVYRSQEERRDGDFQEGGYPMFVVHRAATTGGAYCVL